MCRHYHVDTMFGNLLLYLAVAEYRCMALTVIDAATSVLITQETESASHVYQCWVGSAQ